MIDLKRFNRQRPKGLAKIIPFEDGFALRFSRFDIENGQEIPPEVQKISMDELAKKKSDVEKELSALNEIITEVTQLQSPA
jgi:hypothetical protein